MATLDGMGSGVALAGLFWVTSGLLVHWCVGFDCWFLWHNRCAGTSDIALVLFCLLESKAAVFWGGFLCSRSFQGGGVFGGYHVWSQGWNCGYRSMLLVNLCCELRTESFWIRTESFWISLCFLSKSSGRCPRIIGLPWEYNFCFRGWIFFVYVQHI